MALQIRNTLFDPSVTARMTELNRMLANATVIGAVKKSPILKSSQGKYLYEIACLGCMIHLEVSKDMGAAHITTLDNAILAVTGANGLVENDVSNSLFWEIGHEDDLRVG